MPSRRSRAREVSLQLLFQQDLNPGGIPRAEIERFARERLHDDAELTGYCLGLYDGTVSHRAEIDPRLIATAENWRLFIASCSCSSQWPVRARSVWTHG